MQITVENFPRTQGDTEAERASDMAAFMGAWKIFTGKSRDGIIEWYEVERMKLEDYTGQPTTYVDVDALESFKCTKTYAELQDKSYGELVELAQIGNIGI